MNYQSFARPLVTSLALISLAAPAASAQEMAEQEEISYDVGPVEESSASSLGGAEFSLEAEYASAYLKRGVNFGDHAGTGTGKVIVPVGESALLTVGGRYVATSEDYDEAQGFAEVQIPLGPAALFLGYRYLSGDGFEHSGLDYDSRNEFGTMIGTTVVGVNVGVGYFFDTGLDGHYVELRGTKQWEVHGPVSLRAVAAAGFGFDYQFSGSGLNQFEVGLELPITLSDSATLSPFVTASFAGSDLEVGDDTVVGGVSLKMTF